MRRSGKTGLPSAPPPPRAPAQETISEKGRRLREERARRRLAKASEGERLSQTLSLLEEGSIKPSTWLDYLQRVRSLHEFTVGKKLTDPHELDSLRNWILSLPDAYLELFLLEFLDHLYLEGHESGAGNKLIAAVEKLNSSLSKEGRIRLPRVRAALKGYKRLAPSKSRSPAPQIWAAAVAGVLLRKDRPSMALMVMLMFSTYVRPSEAFSIRPDQILPPPRGGRPHTHTTRSRCFPFPRGSHPKPGYLMIQLF